MAAMDHVASVVVAATSPNFVDGGTLVTVVAVAAASVSVIVSLFDVVLVGAVVTLVLVLKKKEDVHIHFIEVFRVSFPNSYWENDSSIIHDI